MKKLLLAVALTSALASPAAAGVPVVDPANIAQTIKVVQGQIQQLRAIQQQVEQATGLANTIGSMGPGQALNILQGAALNYAGETSQLSPYMDTLPGILDALPNSNAGGILGISTSDVQNAKINIESGRRFAIDAFYKGGNASMDQVAARAGVRRAAQRDSATAGYALAVFTKNNLGNLETRMNGLSDSVANSADLRSDVQANSAIALANLEQVTVTNQLLSQLLEVTAANTIANDEDMSSASMSVAAAE